MAFWKMVACALGMAYAFPASAGPAWSWNSAGYRFTWDLGADLARVDEEGSGKRVWQGPLLPGFWLEIAGTRRFVQAEAQAVIDGRVRLRLPGAGTGELLFTGETWGLRFRSLTVHWTISPPAIVGLYYGAAPLSDEQRSIVPSLERPFWPNWSAEGYCVPSAKGAPVQSFFRNWDLGHTTIPLGSFGPSLGTPYAAAYPRPVFSAAMGGANGWVAFGPGSVPDAALSFEVRASTAALEHLYREDLWSPPPGASREWREPLRMAWAPAAWDAFDRLFRSFGVFDAAPAAHQQSHWNTWGNFRNKQYDLRFIADRAADFGAAVLVIDDGWESYTSSGVHHPIRFPRFFEDLKYARSKGLAIGLWEACGWVADPQAAGLSDRDLVLGKDGRPRRATWNMAVNSLGTAKFCLDLSSPRSREFLRRRTARMMRAYAPVLLKLDFGYGLPGPDVGAPRDPALRGERLAFELLRTIRDAAREVDPKVAVQYYGIHPLMRAVTDVVALDDLGDAGGYEAEAHGQWSVWSALAAAQGVAVMASSGYDWAADAEILLNTAVIGSPGSVLPVPAPPDAVPARRAVARWHRRTTGWRPLWLNSEKGSIGHEPRVRCWGRLEGPDHLTAVALREDHPEGAAAAPLHGMKWRGRWALISQDEQDIFHTRLLACIPFGSGWLELPVAARPAQVTVAYGDREAPLAGWTFRDGRLRFRAPVGALGVLIRR